ncbi:hypothetical protein AAFN86_22615 [Roseomonas sp. CAU 1739]|uniref:hypothetical protein n=1 Tax=Roseomonas sp. CAU 1739 TaxID=3140364 RepID=UPI00325B62C5
MRSILLAGLVLAAPPLARACDTEALNAELTAVCTAALRPATAWAAALRAQATAVEGAALDRAIAAATAACETGDPAAGAAETVRIARLAGRIEARTGQAEPIWPDRLASR